jgi:ribonuclease HI
MKEALIKESKHLDKFELYFDGSCEPINPGGTMGVGVVVKKNGVNIANYSQRIKLGEEGFFQTTNNIAEYLALRKGLEFCIGNHIRDVMVFGDSQLVINQMKGLWQAKQGAYLSQFIACKVLAAHFKSIAFTWIPRERNTEADNLSKTKNDAKIKGDSQIELRI